MFQASAYIGSGQKVVLSLEDIPITGTPLVEGIQVRKPTDIEGLSHDAY